jgi:hypothetical protein
MEDKMRKGTTVLLIIVAAIMFSGIAVSARDKQLAIPKDDYTKTINTTKWTEADTSAGTVLVLNSVNFPPFGFGIGVADGSLWLFKWIISWFKHDMHLFTHANNGASYLIGFILGLFAGSLYADLFAFIIIRIKSLFSRN